MFNETTHTGLCDTSPAKYLDSINSALLGEMGTLHLEERDLPVSHRSGYIIVIVKSTIPC